MTNDRFELELLTRGSPTNLADLPANHSTAPSNFPYVSYGDYGYHRVDDRVNLRELWLKIFKHRWLIISVMVIVTTIVTIAVLRIKPWYRATTVIEVGKDNGMVLKPGDVVLNEDTDPLYLVNINTKKLSLSSYELFEEVVVDQKLDENPKVIEAVERKPLLPFWQSDEARSVPNVTVKQPVKNANSPTAGQPPIEPSAKLTRFVQYVEDNIVVEPVKDARALQVTFTSEDPQLAANITNSVAQLFIARSFSNQTEKFNNSANWLETSTRQLKSKVEGAETALANYTRDNQIYATNLGPNENDKNQTLTTGSLIQLHDQLIRTQTDRMLKQSLFEQLQQGRIAELPEVFSDPKIIEAQKQLNQLVTQEAELKVRFGPTNPKIGEIQNQVAALTSQIETSKNALQNKLKADYERAVRDEQSLQAALDKSKTEAVNENQASIKLNVLKQEVDTARGLYTDFLQKTNQAKAQAAEQNNNIKVVQRAQVPLTPVGPKRTMLILAGFFLSLGAGIGLAFLVDYFDNTIKTVDDVQTNCQVPMLGLIPKKNMAAPFTLFGFGKRNTIQAPLFDDPSELAMVNRPNDSQVKLLKQIEERSMTGEAYRTLRTSFLMSHAGSPPKTILITSGQSSEGKTTTAVNMAISLSQLGANVLIVDCDLRRPSVHKRLGILPAKGLSTYLSSDAQLGDLIQETEIPNLSVLPSGATPPNPAELISSKKMREMLQTMGQRFDHIIIDSPPLIGMTDSMILSGLVDGTIIIASAGRTTREILRRCCKELMTVHSKLLGIVLNNASMKQNGYDYYKYYDYSPQSADSAEQSA